MQTIISTLKPQEAQSPVSSESGMFISMNANLTYNGGSEVLDQIFMQEPFRVIIPGVIQLRYPFSTFALPQVILVSDHTYSLQQIGDVLFVRPPSHRSHKTKIGREIRRLETKLTAEPWCNVVDVGSYSDSKKKTSLFTRSRRRVGDLLDGILSKPLFGIDADVDTTAGNNITINSATNGTINHIKEGKTSIREVGEGANVKTYRLGQGDITDSGRPNDSPAVYMEAITNILKPFQHVTPTTAKTTTTMSPMGYAPPFGNNFMSHPIPNSGFGSQNLDFYYKSGQKMAFPLFQSPFQQMPPFSTNGKLSPVEEEKLYQRLYQRLLQDVAGYLQKIFQPQRRRRDTNVNFNLWDQIANLTETYKTRRQPAHIGIVNQHGTYDIYHLSPPGKNSTLNVSYSNGTLKIFPDSSDESNDDIIFDYDYPSTTSKNHSTNNSYTTSDIIDAFEEYFTTDSTVPPMKTNRSFLDNPRSIRFYLILAVFCTFGFLCFLIVIRLVIRFVHRSTDNNSCADATPLPLLKNL